MKIALTGGSGGIGRAVVAAALAQGHSIVNVDRVAPTDVPVGVSFVQADLADYDAVLSAFTGCDALIHLGAIPQPFRLPDHVVHNNNVVGSFNAIHAAVTVGIRRICQASSVNAVGLSFNRRGMFDYFPIDEHHPCHTEEAYGLSKWICEQQADTFVRRYDDLSIASLRFHWAVPSRAHAGAAFNVPTPEASKHLWGYVLTPFAAQACLLALTAPFTGHEAFYIAAPDTTNDIPSIELAATYYPTVPVRGALPGTTSFFDTSKARRILGWSHPGSVGDV